MTMELTGKRALILGAGVTGRGAARFLLKKGAEVTLADDAPLCPLPAQVEELKALGLKIAAGGLEKVGTDYELAILSPGISVNDPRVKALRDAGVEVIGELELAFRHLSAPVVAITGTNGKTTVTNLAGELLKAAGKKVFVGGNVGTPLVEAVDGDYELAVVEVSSFQLEAAPTFRPRVAVWLNLTGDHLDRHGDLPGYASAKAEIFRNMGRADALVANRDDEWVWSYSQKAGATLLPYSTNKRLGVGSWLEGEEIILLMPGTDGRRLPAKPMELKGLHNIGNVMAATLAVSALGIDMKPLWPVVQGFKGLGHRLQKFHEWKGITFVDDSKATNVDAAVKAVETVNGPLVLLAGGVEKGSDYLALREGVEKFVRLVVLVGPNTAKLAKDLEGAAPITIAADWPEGVKAAIAAAKPGDTVLLAPACSSFDFFKSYAERGDVFQKLVVEYTKEAGFGDG